MLTSHLWTVPSLGARLVISSHKVWAGLPGVRYTGLTAHGVPALLLPLSSHRHLISNIIAWPLLALLILLHHIIGILIALA